MNIKHFLPILDWLPNYKKAWLKGDIIAGLTVGVLLIPQGIAYANIAELPAIYGLYASIVPLLVYAIFGTSRQLAVGPTAMVSLLTVAAIGSIKGLSPEEYIFYAILLAFLVGAIQFLMGVFRLGFLVNFLSHPVISGFTSAVALIIGFGQLKGLLGINIPRSKDIFEIGNNIYLHLNDINWTAFAIGITGIILIFAIKRINKALPSLLFAVLFGILAVTFLGLGSGNNAISIVGDIPKKLPTFTIPMISWETIKILLPMALTIALLSFMESIAIAKAIHAKHRDYKVMPNQELMGLGLANVIGSFFQSYPTTGGFSRTAINNKAGAKTGLAAIISVTLVILTLLFLTPLFFNLPKTILSAVILVAVLGLMDFKEALHLWKSDRTDFALLLITFLGTLIIGIDLGIGLGVLLSLVIVIFKTTSPHVAVLGNIPNTHFYRNIKRFKDDLIIKEDVLIVRFDAQLYFANTAFFKDKIEELVENKGDKLKLVILDGESMNNLDSSGVHALKEIIDTYSSLGVELAFVSMKGPVRDAMIKGGVMEKNTFDNCYMSIQEAIDCYEAKCEGKSIDSKYQKYIQQRN